MTTVDGIEVTPAALGRALRLAEQAEEDAVIEQRIADSLREHAYDHERSAIWFGRAGKRHREWLAKASADRLGPS